MNLSRLTFCHAALNNLPEAEQLFFIRLAHVRNDLRHIDSLCRIAVHSVNSTIGVERDVALHQLLFALRLLYGVLNETWTLVQSGWNGTDLAATFQHRLSSKAKESLSALNRYFGKDNLVRTLRDNFAFHYFSENLRDVIAKVRANEQHEFISGRNSRNVFYTFAEKLCNAAMVDATAETNVLAAVRKLYDEPFRVVYPHFRNFSDAILFEIAKSFGIHTESFKTTSLTDVADIPPLTFMNEDVVAQDGRI